MNKIYPEDFGCFQSESLKLDYIRFTLTYLDADQILKLAFYFQTLGFNSYQKEREENQSRQDIQFDPNNKFEVVFIFHIRYQKGTHIEFSGSHAMKLYALMKQKQIQWKNLTDLNASLSRFDICYDRPPQSTDKINSSEFMNLCFQQFQSVHPSKNLGMEKNKQGLLFKIGNRRSQRYYRLYTKKNLFLRFEFEFKLNSFYQLLLESRFEEFEKNLSYQFFKYSFEIFGCAQYPDHIDWLINRIRPYTNQHKRIQQESMISSDYINQFAFDQFQQKLDFILLLQLLMYVQNLDYQTKTLRSRFRQFKFPVSDFLKYSAKESNYYQLRKVITFLEALRKNLVIECFTDNSYRMLVTIPEVFVSKSDQNVWIAEIWIADQLFSYLHPFLFPDFFRKKLSKDEFQVLFEIIKIFSSPNTRKEFHMKQFFQSTNQNLNGLRKKHIREYFIRYLNVLYQQEKLQKQVILLPTLKSYLIKKDKSVPFN